MLFSATLSPEINKLASWVLRDPQTVEAGERQHPVAAVEQRFYSAPQQSKMDLLLHALSAEKMQSVLIFSRTKHGADKICHRLERSSIASVAIHSNRTQSQRERALEGFRRGKFRVLVATDIAARGIDVSGISHVINYDIPPFAEDYLHRIGRTARAGATGDAITFVGQDDQQYVKRIEQFVGKRFHVKPYPGFTAPERQVPPPTQAATGHARHGAPDRHRTGTGPHRKKQTPMATPRKKGPTRVMDSYSSDGNSGGWSNH
jgi:ATP-dependent RNA helicase RhlE